MISRQKIIQNVLQYARIAVIVFGRHDDERIGASNLFAELAQARRRVITKPQTLFHNRKIVFEKIEYFSLYLFIPAYTLMYESGDFGTLPISAGAAQDYRNIEHIIPRLFKRKLI